MANGGRADQETIEELAARKLARVLGYGEPWRAIAHLEQSEESEHERDRLTVKQVIGGEITGTAAIPTWRPDYNVMAALSFAKLTDTEEAVLRFYAGDMSAWPAIERGMKARGHSSMAIVDGLSLVLWPNYQREGSITIKKRAAMLHVRYVIYLEKVQAARRELADMLRYASMKLMLTLNGNRIYPRLSKIEDKEFLHRPAKFPGRAVSVNTRHPFEPVVSAYPQRTRIQRL